jgi:tRNA threonylcarbamoyladenosine biosynthesis protein TsaE
VVKTYNIIEINSIAKEVWEFGKPFKTWAFYAPMGAGKTTFIHALCDLLQVQETVGSPTFALINEYTSPIAGTIYHMDWYRLKDEQEAIQAGMEDAILSGNYCFIEWAEKAEDLLPDSLLKINIELVDELNRKITLTANASA